MLLFGLGCNQPGERAGMPRRAFVKFHRDHCGTTAWILDARRHYSKQYNPGYCSSSVVGAVKNKQKDKTACTLDLAHKLLRL